MAKDRNLATSKDQIFVNLELPKERTKTAYGNINSGERKLEWPSEQQRENGASSGITEEQIRMDFTRLV